MVQKMICRGGHAAVSLGSVIVISLLILPFFAAAAPSAATISSAASVNRYTYLVGDEGRDATITVASGAGFNNGDKILIIQITNGNGRCQAGIYEYAYIQSGGGTSTFTLASPLRNTYCRVASGFTATAQVVKVAEYTDLTVTSSGRIVPASSWNGLTGGIIAIDVYGKLQLDGTIDASAAGFRGSDCGISFTVCNNCPTCPTGESYDGYWRYPSPYRYSGGGGSGILSYYGFAGGGGGGYGSAGGNAQGIDGHDGWKFGLTSLPASSAIGYGGYTYGSANLESGIFFGSGGGAAGYYATPGGAGGGIVIINSGQVAGNGYVISNGQNGVYWSRTSGGAGGGILLRAGTSTFPSSHITVNGGSAGGTTCGSWACNDDKSCWPITIYYSGGAGGVGRQLIRTGLAQVNIESVSIAPVNGGAEIEPDEVAKCSATLASGSSASVGYSFFRVTPDGKRYTESADSQGRFDCNGKCSPGDKIGCVAFASPSSSSVLGNSKESALMPVIDSCVVRFIFSSLQSGSRTHQLVCARQDLASLSSKMVKKECIGDDEAIGATNLAYLGESWMAGATYSARLQSSDAPLPKVSADKLLRPDGGAVLIDLRPAWDGREGLNYRLFHYVKDSDNWMLIQKTAQGNMRCEYAAGGSVVGAESPIGSWVAGTKHTVLMGWNSTQKILSCKVDDDPVVVSSLTNTIPASGAPGELVVGGAINAGMAAKAQMNVTLMVSPEPIVVYCAQDASWDTSLDLKGKPSCESAKLKWTGTACCGEAGDKPEFYSDPVGATPPATVGACWNSSLLPSGSVAPGTQEKVISIAGSLLGCGLSPGEPMLSMVDAHASRPLIQQASFCTLAHDIGGNPLMNLFCSPRLNKWKETSSNKDLALSASPKDPNDKDCCIRNSDCWDGKACVADQSNDPMMTLTEGYRCVKGVWQAGDPKYTPDRSGKGFCPRKEDCLWNPQGSSANNYVPMAYLAAQGEVSKQPACLADGQYIRDALCLEGNWTTRTKGLVLELIDFAESESPGDYAIFCGDYSDVLNFIDYDPETLGSGSLSDYISSNCYRQGVRVPCVNNFCALRLSDGRTGFGTSLNMPINDPQSSFLKALGLGSGDCNAAAVDDGRFHPCVSSAWYEDVWSSLLQAVGAEASPSSTILYNHGLQAILSLPSAGSGSSAGSAGAVSPPLSKPVLKRSREPMINLPMGALRSFSETALRRPFRDPLANVSSFNRLFILKSQNRDYFAFLEKDVFFDGYVDVAALAYDGIAVTDPLTGKAACDLLADKINPALLSAYDCSYDRVNGRLRMLAISRTPLSGAGATPLRSFWRDMTAKLR